MAGKVDGLGFEIKSKLEAIFQSQYLWAKSVVAKKPLTKYETASYLWWCKLPWAPFHKLQRASFAQTMKNTVYLCYFGLLSNLSDIVMSLTLSDPVN